MDITKVDNLKTWFAEKVFECTLKSGLKVVIKKATTEELIIEGSIPVPLVAEYYKVAGKDLTDVENPEVAKQLDESLQSLAAYFEAICHAVLVWPKIGEKLDLENGIITQKELSFSDKQEIANAAQRGVQLLETFPAK